MYDQGDQFPDMEAPMPTQHELATDNQLTPPEKPDTYQQARMALRDRYGIEPDRNTVHDVIQTMEDSDLTPAAAVSVLALANAPKILDPDAADREDEQARAFVKAFHRMDRMLSQARDTIRNRDQRISEIETKAKRDLERAAAAHEQDARIRAWQAVSAHPYFRELSEDAAHDERSWLVIVLERLDQLAERPKTSGIDANGYTVNQPSGTISIAISSRGFGGTATTVESADTTAGLARLRAHSALDGLLDRHGISR